MVADNLSKPSFWHMHGGVHSDARVHAPAATQGRWQLGIRRIRRCINRSMREAADISQVLDSALQRCIWRGGFCCDGYCYR